MGPGTKSCRDTTGRNTKKLNKNFIYANGTGAVGTYEHRRVADGSVTEIESKNTFDGTVRNLVHTTDQGDQVNLSAL